MNGGYTLVLGLGITGASVVRHLAGRTGLLAMDSRAEPPFAASLAREHPEVRQLLGGFDRAVIDGAECIVASPGIAGLDDLTATARARGVPVLSDIDLFAREARAPVLGITGTNGKSTTTELTGAALRAAGVRVAIGGNLGVPALALLDPSIECYVLELSSFQLDLTNELRCRAATVLNVTPDHLDRYGDMASYTASKQRIYRGVDVAVVNRADAATTPTGSPPAVISFGIDAPGPTDFGVVARDGARTLAHGATALLRADALRLRGTHNEANALAALALASTVGAALPAAAAALATFDGLPHRCQHVATIGGVEFIDDSKATNEGAALAALAGVGAAIRGRVVLIAGGDGKGTEFADLAAALPGPVRAVVTIGKDAAQIETALASKVPVHRAEHLDCAVPLAYRLAEAGDCVLLAPACASLDQFRDFNHRGDCFAAAVLALRAEHSA